MKAAMPVLSHLEVRYFNRQLEEPNGDQSRTSQSQPVRDYDQMIRIRNHRRDPDGVSQADRHATVDGGSAKRLVDETLLRRMSAACGPVHQMRSLQELFE